MQRPARPHQEIDPGGAARRGERRREIAGGEQLHAGAGGTHLPDQLRVARALQNRDREVLDVDALRLGERFQIVCRRALEVDDAAAVGADSNLLHVGVGALQEDVVIGDRDDRERAGAAGRADARALERVEGDLGGGAALADAIAGVQQRRLVGTALADQHRAAHRNRVERTPHRLDGGAIRPCLVAASHVARRRERGSLRDADDLERQVAVH